jgi:Protein of unknown function (DUF4231)
MDAVRSQVMDNPATDHPSEHSVDAEYLDLVRSEIVRLRRFFTKKLNQYRTVRAVVIVSAALVPILAAVESTPRWLLGLFGGAAAIMGAVQELYQPRRTASAARKTAIALELTLNKYVSAVAPFDGPVSLAFPCFVDRIEAIRDRIDLEAWESETTTSSTNLLVDRQRSKPEGL